MDEFLKNPELLSETSRDNDFFGFSEYAKNLHKNLSTNNGPTVTMLVGPYGAGKSVLLNEVKKITHQSEAKHKPRWVTFECWQYPDKRDLWEGFILEIVGSIEGESRRNKLQTSYSDMPNWRAEVSKLLNNAKTAIGTIIAVTALMFIVLTINNDVLSNVLVSIVTATAVLLLAGIAFVVRPESKSAISRLTDYKEELEDVLVSHEGTLFIVLEDVDRAEKLGVMFFEIVSHFIKSTELKHKNIKIIVPISDDSSNKSLTDSMEKVSDNILYFSPHYDAEMFLVEVFKEEFLDNETKDMLISIINPLIRRQISIRKMKQILRNAIAKHKRLSSTNFPSKLAICIAVEFSKYIKTEYGDSSLYRNATHQYKFGPLLAWASAKGLLDTTTDIEEKEIMPRDFFKQSGDRFADIRFSDIDSGSRGSKQIYYREYLISKTYFDDL